MGGCEPRVDPGGGAPSAEVAAQDCGEVWDAGLHLGADLRDQAFDFLASPALHLRASSSGRAIGTLVHRKKKSMQAHASRAHRQVACEAASHALTAGGAVQAELVSRYHRYVVATRDVPGGLA